MRDHQGQHWLRPQQLLALFMGLAIVLIGCAQPSGGGNSGGEKAQEDEGIFPKATAQEKACMDLWNSPDNSEQQERAKQGTAKAILGAYSERSYASFTESSDFPGECEVVIAVPEIDQARLVRTGGGYELEGFLFGPADTNSGTMDQVIREPLKWNGFIDSSGRAIESASEQTGGEFLDPTPGRCVGLWDKSGGSVKTVLGSLAIWGQGEARAAQDSQFPDQCLVSAAFPSESTVYLFRSTGTIAETVWRPAGEVPLDEILPEYTDWMASVGEDGELEPYSRAVANEAREWLQESSSEDSPGEDSLRRAEPPTGYPKLVPNDSSGCGNIVVDPKSLRGGLLEIKPVGIACEEAVEILISWLEKRNESPDLAGLDDGPDGWDCDQTVQREMQVAVYDCARGDERLYFEAS